MCEDNREKSEKKKKKRVDISNMSERWNLGRKSKLFQWKEKNFPKFVESVRKFQDDLLKQGK